MLTPLPDEQILIFLARSTLLYKYGMSANTAVVAMNFSNTTKLMEGFKKKKKVEFREKIYTGLKHWILHNNLF